jgi:hypothetical protein
MEREEMNQISVEEIEAAVDGGADSAAMKGIIRKLGMVKKPPKHLDDPRVRDMLVRSFGVFLRDPLSAFTRATGVAVEASRIARIAMDISQEMVSHG